MINIIIRLSKSITFIFLPVVIAILLLNNNLIAQSVAVGQGSYGTVLPAGAVGPSYASGESAIPKIDTSFNQPVKTNDFWSSLIYPFIGNQYSNNIYAHPLFFKAVDAGLQIGYSPTPAITDNDYYFPITDQLQVGINGLIASNTLTKEYGDWTVTAVWADENSSLEATIGHGLPYAFFKVTGGNATISTTSTPTIWHNENEVLGITINGMHYGIFAPSGSIWTGTSDFESALNGKDYLSIAVLPDSDPITLEFFRKHAYAFVTNSIVDWEYDEANAQLITTYTYETELKDSSESNIDETLTALYRHQWLNTSSPLTSYTYNSPRGEMKLYEGNSFTTSVLFSGILPSLPDLGNYSKSKLLEFIQDVRTESLNSGPTYENGKAMARFANLVPIADQLGAINERDYFLNEMKNRLEEWFSVGGSGEYIYNSTWNSLTGYPSGYGADNQLNDHHFHSSYAIYTAAIIAQYDSAWASLDNWGGMVNLLIKDSNNWDREDTQFPFLRNHDEYAGHSWASGHADFGDGNNQESSSESMNFSAATFLWGEITGQIDIRDLGIYLYSTEATAIDQYWFDVDNEVFPSDYSKKALGIVWGNKGVHNTWFGNRPEFIHGINFLPITSASVYLGKNPDFIIENYNEIVTELGSQPTVWKDVIWSYLSLGDADLALSLYLSDQNYAPFDGLSRAHTLHWLYNLKRLGHFNTVVSADIPTYNVFVNNNDTTYIAYNAGDEDRIVNFSDGFSFNVPANKMRSFSTGNSSEIVTSSAPPPSFNQGDVISIFSDNYENIPGTNFNPIWGQGTLASIVSIQGNETLKYENLDFQGTEINGSIDVSNMNFLHLDYWTADASELKIFLLSSGPKETFFTIDIEYYEWKSITIPLSEYSDIVDLEDITQLKIEGNGTVFFDNILFSNEFQLTPAPSPTINSDNVLSIFSDDYENIPGTNFNPNWGQETVSTIVSIEGNQAIKYENLNFQGTQIDGSINVSEMDSVHVNYLTRDATALKFYLISPGPQETDYIFDIKYDEWQSINIPLTQYSNVVDLKNVFQFKVSGNGTVYLDNIYFFKNNIAISTESRKDKIPEKFTLSQNYPNPFNPSTKIAFSVPKTAAVAINIYNAIGQLITTLVDSQLTPGNYNVIWDASNLTSGVYFYQLTSGNVVSSRKMLLIK